MIIINGKKYNGKSISINNNKIIIDGKDCTPDSKTIDITVQGNINELNVDSCNSLMVIGEVAAIKTQSGDVECNIVNGNVSTMSGDVKCNNIGGSVKTMSGDINSLPF